MQFDKLIQEIKTVPFAALRMESDTYFEAVVSNHDIKELNSKLEIFFGAPVEYFPDKLPPKSHETIEKFGGIDPGQILYFSSEGNSAVFAMLWPWQDEKHTTLKIIKI